MNGSQQLVSSLRNAGIDTLFSLSGNQIMPVYDACIDHDIRIIHTRHEGAAVYMAECAGQLTGRPGVALVTAGPGFGNAVGALFTARESDSPLLLLSGDSPAALDGHGAFQEMPQTAVAGPLVKYSERITCADEIGEAVTHALAVANHGRKGPVHLALAADALTGEVSSAPPSGNRQENSSSPIESGRQARSPDLLQVLAKAARPLILTGPQLSYSREPTLCTALEQATGCPVICLESPRGGRDPALGRILDLFRQSDCIILLGKQLNFQISPAMAPEADWHAIEPEIESIDRLQRLLGSRLKTCIQTDPQQFAAQLADSGNTEQTAKAAWFNTVSQGLASRPALRNQDDHETLALVNTIREQLDSYPDAVVICDGGEFGQWAQSALGPLGSSGINADNTENAGITGSELINRRSAFRITNGPSGAIGASIPYAIAAGCIVPDRPVIAILGDGTAGFHLAEFETAARVGVSVVMIIANDSRWNAEHQIQINNWGESRTIGCQLSPNVAYEQIAVSLGLHGVAANDPASLASALSSALARSAGAAGSTVINLQIPGAGAPVF